MKLKIVKEQVWHGVIEILTKYGFVFNKKFNWLERKIPDGIQIFDLIFYDYSEQILIKPIFRIKLNPIEDIYHQITQKEKKYNYATLTLGNSLGQIMKFYDYGDKKGSGEQISYVLENERDTETIIEIISKNFELYVLPYFEQFSTIQQVDKLLNENPREMSIHNYLYPLRACIAIIAAKLVNRENFDELVKAYQEKMINASPVYREEFENLVKLLALM